MAQANITFTPDGSFVPDIIVTGQTAGAAAPGVNLVTQALSQKGLWHLKYRFTSDAGVTVFLSSNLRLSITRTAGGASQDLDYGLIGDVPMEGNLIVESFDPSDLLRLMGGPLGVPASGTAYMMQLTYLGTR